MFYFFIKMYLLDIQVLIILSIIYYYCFQLLGVNK